MTQIENGYQCVVTDTSEGSKYYKFQVAESGVYDISYDNCEGCCNVFYYKLVDGERIALNNNYNQNQMYFSSKDQIVVEVCSPATITVVKAEKSSSVADMAFESLDFDQAAMTAEKSDDGTYYQLTVTIPVKKGSYVSSHGATEYWYVGLANNRGTIGLNYDAEKNVITGQISVSNSYYYETTLNYSIDYLDLLDWGAGNNWYKFYLKGTSGGKDYTETYYVDKVPSVSIDISGPIELEAGKKYLDFTNGGSSIYYKFTPENIGYYQPVLEAGSTYFLTVDCPEFGNYFQLNYHSTVVSVSDVVLDEPVGSHVTGKIKLNVQGGSIKSVSFGEYEPTDVNVTKEDDGTWTYTFERFGDENSSYTVSQFIVYDNDGGTWEFKNGTDFTSPEVQLGTVIDYLITLKPGDVVNNVPNITISDSLTLPEGITINGGMDGCRIEISEGVNFIMPKGSTFNCDFIIIREGASLTIPEGSSVNSSCSVENGATLTVEGSLNGEGFGLGDGSKLIATENSSINLSGGMSINTKSIINSKKTILFSNDWNATYEINVWYDENKDPLSSLSSLFKNFAFQKGLLLNVWYGKTTSGGYKNRYTRIWNGISWVTEAVYNEKAHKWVTTSTQAATVFKAGYISKKCSICGKTTKTTLAKLTPTIKLSATKKTIKKKKTYTLVVSKLANGDSVKSVTSSKKSIATVKKLSAKKYKITGKKSGKSKITVTLKSGKKATCTVTVK